MDVIKSNNTGYNPALLERFGRDLTDEQLLDTWLAELRPDESFAVRDSIVETMIRRGVALHNGFVAVKHSVYIQI